MLLLRLWNYMRGYVIIIVEGYFLEKFINVCIHRQIFLWNIERQSNCMMTLKVSIKGFKLLKPVARKTNCRIRIVKKRGLPFTMNRYRGRKTFLVGAVIFIILMYVLSSFVWTVEVTGNKNLETQAVLDELASFGVKPGVLKYTIDTDTAVNNMMIDMRELAWIGIVVKGTKVKVQLVEGKKPPELIPKNDPCNVVASRDGVVKSIIGKAGQDMVKVGDTVTKGQILISGTIKSENAQIKESIVHAIGVVNARTWYEGSCDVTTKTVTKERTGSVKDIYAVDLFSKRIDLLPGKVPFEDYEQVEIKKKLSFGEDFVFPFEFVIDRFYETTLAEREVSLDAAKQIASDTAYKNAMKDIPQDVEIVKTNTDFKHKDNGDLTANVIIECAEDIGVTEKIGGK